MESIYVTDAGELQPTSTEGIHLLSLPYSYSISPSEIYLRGLSRILLHSLLFLSP
jgi:hypothetical protein